MIIIQNLDLNLQVINKIMENKKNKKKKKKAMINRKK